MSFEWDEEKVTKFLREYQKHPCLWNPYHPDHYYCSKKNEAFKKIIEKLQFPGLNCTECLHQIKVIKERYAREQIHVLGNLRAGTKDKPSFPWYDLVSCMLIKVIKDEEKWMGIETPSDTSIEHLRNKSPRGNPEMTVCHNRREPMSPPKYETLVKTNSMEKCNQVLSCYDLHRSKSREFKNTKGASRTLRPVPNKMQMKTGNIKKPNNRSFKKNMDTKAKKIAPTRGLDTCMCKSKSMRQIRTRDNIKSLPSDAQKHPTTTRTTAKSYAGINEIPTRDVANAECVDPGSTNCPPCEWMDRKVERQKTAPSLSRKTSEKLVPRPYYADRNKSRYEYSICDSRPPRNPDFFENLVPCPSYPQSGHDNRTGEIQVPCPFTRHCHFSDDQYQYPVHLPPNNNNNNYPDHLLNTTCCIRPEQLVELYPTRNDCLQANDRELTRNEIRGKFTDRRYDRPSCLEAAKCVREVGNVFDRGLFEPRNYFSISGKRFQTDPMKCVQERRKYDRDDQLGSICYRLPSNREVDNLQMQPKGCCRETQYSLPRETCCSRRACKEIATEAVQFSDKGVQNSVCVENLRRKLQEDSEEVVLLTSDKLICVPFLKARVHQESVQFLGEKGVIKENAEKRNECSCGKKRTTADVTSVLNQLATCIQNVMEISALKSTKVEEKLSKNDITSSSNDTSLSEGITVCTNTGLGLIQGDSIDNESLQLEPCCCTVDTQTEAEKAKTCERKSIGTETGAAKLQDKEIDTNFLRKEIRDRTIQSKPSTCSEKIQTNVDPERSYASKAVGAIDRDANSRDQQVDVRVPTRDIHAQSNLETAVQQTQTLGSVTRETPQRRASCSTGTLTRVPVRNNATQGFRTLEMLQRETAQKRRPLGPSQNKEIGVDLVQRRDRSSTGTLTRVSVENTGTQESQIFGIVPTQTEESETPSIAHRDRGIEVDLIRKDNGCRGTLPRICVRESREKMISSVCTNRRFDPQCVKCNRRDTSTATPKYRKRTRLEVSTAVERSPKLLTTCHPCKRTVLPESEQCRIPKATFRCDSNCSGTYDWTDIRTVECDAYRNAPKLQFLPCMKEDVVTCRIDSGTVLCPSRET